MDASKIKRRIKWKNESRVFFIVTLRLPKQQVWSEQFKEDLKACLLQKERTGDQGYCDPPKIEGGGEKDWR
jgi:hypothetical protein